MARDPAWVVSVQHDFGGLGLPWLHLWILWYPAPLGQSGQQQCIEGEAACVNRLSNHCRNLAETILAARVICTNPQFCHQALWWTRHVSRKQYWYRRILAGSGIHRIHMDTLLPKKNTLLKCENRFSRGSAEGPICSSNPWGHERHKFDWRSNDKMRDQYIEIIEYGLGQVYTMGSSVYKCCKSMQVIAKVIQDIVVWLLCAMTNGHTKTISGTIETSKLSKLQGWLPPHQLMAACMQTLQCTGYWGKLTWIK